jgi:hypothetical protein
MCRKWFEEVVLEEYKGVSLLELNLMDYFFSILMVSFYPLLTLPLNITK